MKNNNINMQNTECKRPRMERILDLLITLTLALLLLASYARGGEDELIKHLNSSSLPYSQYMREGWNEVDIKAKLPEFIDYSSDPGRISPILEKIADNPVGKLTLCLLYQARHNMPKERLRIFVDDREPKFGGGMSTGFCSKGFCICLNTHQTTHTFGMAYVNGHISSKYNTFDASLFHEINHVLHKVMGNMKDKTSETLEYIYKTSKIKYLWCNMKKDVLYDEEFYNITGKYLWNGELLYDPLNCNLYEAIEYSRLGYSTEWIPQRMFHCFYDKKFCAPCYLYKSEMIVSNFS
ncbi:MAG: hypothetical protein IJ599_03615 [Alphaproteobacteria bacterium]|nr:hypothetical protein [Alphaproteobacteria bacterium]